MSEQRNAVEAKCEAAVEEERRAAVRYPCAQGAACSVGPTQERTTGKACDLSTLGVGLQLSRGFEPGTPLLVELKDRATSAVLELPARVIYAIRHASGRWRVGCEFDTPLSEEELQALL